MITVGVGGRSSQFVEPVRTRLVDRLEELIEYAASRGVTIAIEPHVRGMIDRPERVLWLLDRIRSPYLKVNFDDSHFAVQGIPLSETVPALAPHNSSHARQGVSRSRA